MQNEPFPITDTDRQKCVDTLMRIIEDGEPEDQIEACRVLIEADALNLQSATDGWLGKYSNN